MAIAHSRLTAQGQISVPAKVRRKLGVGPGSVLEWEGDAGKIVVRRAGCFDSADIHRELFGSRQPAPHTAEEMKAGITGYIERRHASG